MSTGRGVTPGVAARFALAGALLPLASTCTAGQLVAPSGLEVEVVRTHPHDPEAYTQGLLFHDGDFYESTGLYGSSTLRRVDVESGSPLLVRHLEPAYFGEGLTILDGRLYQLTWKEGVVLVYDLATLDLLGSLPYPGDGWGLTSDDTHLILSDGTYVLRFLDPGTLEPVRRIEVTFDGRFVAALNELEWVRGEIWANIYQDPRIARIDPVSGQVVGWLSTGQLPGGWEHRGGVDAANGIAYDSATDRLWLTGKRWPLVFEVKRPD